MSRFGQNHCGRTPLLRAPGKVVPLVLSLVVILGFCWSLPLAAQSATRVELPSGVTVIHHDNNLSHTAQVSLLVRSAPLWEGQRLGSGVSNVLRQVLAQRWRSLKGDRLGPLQSETDWATSGYTVTTADSQILPSVAALAQLVNPQEWSEAAVSRAVGDVQAELALRSRRMKYLERDALFRLALVRHPARLPPAGRPQQVATLDLEQLRLWHQQSYRAPAMTVVVVGNCDQQQLFAKIEEVFAPFALGGWVVPVVPQEPNNLLLATARWSQSALTVIAMFLLGACHRLRGQNSGVVVVSSLGCANGIVTAALYRRATGDRRED